MKECCVKAVDVVLFVSFIIVTVLAHLFGYHFLLEHPQNQRLAHLHFTVALYGAAQSFFGFAAGYVMARIAWESEYKAVESAEI
jgi:hypothetical protein